MKLNKIHQMFWADAEHTVVGLVADLDDQINARIGTPYDETSIIWNYVKEFPVDQIDPFDPNR